MTHNNKIITLFENLSSKIQNFTNKTACSDVMNVEIQEQASLWLSKLARGFCKQEKLDFQQWAKQSDFHRNSLFSLAALGNDLSVLNELSTLFPLEKPAPKKIYIMTKYAISASFISIILFSSIFYLNSTSFSSANNEQQFIENRTLQTVVGQQTRFSLSDGSSIKLNTNSLVEVSFSKNKRLLTLIRGEGHFDVAKDKSRPFSVSVGERSFTALGTIFNVQKITDIDMELVVSEGRVLITKSNRSSNHLTETPLAFSNVQSSGLVVTAGEMTTISNSIQLPVQKTSLEQVERKLAWQQGMLVFNGQSLAEALAEISRYTTTEFEINEQAMTQIKVAGYFKANDIDGLLNSLSSNFNIQFEQINKNAIRLRMATPESKH